MDPKRRSFQLINGVLVETTIEEVLPKVEANKDGLYSITQNLQEKLDKLSKEISTYQEKYKITVQRPGMNMSSMPEPVISGGGENRTAGVLA
jgi:prefoldin subunit 5